MASPNASYTDIFTTTLESRTAKLADNVLENNGLLKKLKDKGNVRPISGGSKILEELEYGEGDMVWYNGYDAITYAPKQLFTAAEYALKLCAVPVAISGEDLLKNSGREQMIDLFEKRIENGRKTMMNKMSEALYGDGTGSAGKEINGLKLFVADDPATGTVGGINRATGGNEFWRNQTKTAAAKMVPETIIKNMNELFIKCSRGSEAPDLIVTGDDLYSTYENALQVNQRFTDSKMAEAGFQNLKFKGAVVLNDGGQGGRCPAGKMYFLNTDYLYLRPHKDRNMVVVGGNRMAVDKDALYKIIGWAGNLTMSNAKMQGVLIDGLGV